MKDRRFVLLDRDGTIIVERNYLSNPEEVELLPGAASGLRKLKNLGLGVLVITNQSAIGRGFIDEARLDEIHKRMGNLLEDEGIILDGIYHCPHHPDVKCNCRKPETGLPKLAAKEFGFKVEDSIVIGDKECDIELGHHLGAMTFLVLTGYGKKTALNKTIKPNYIVEDLNEAANTIEPLLKQGNEILETEK